jgi:hypothetical protein
MAPHVNFWIVARGINFGLNTRMYFSDQAEANARDPVLGLIEQGQRRQTLIAPRSDRDGRAVYTFDIHLQGERETVFLDVWVPKPAITPVAWLETYEWCRKASRRCTMPPAVSGFHESSR